jgi:ferritin-like metal-binding protein YciE
MTLKDLYIDELRDLYSAETQILDALPKLAAAASAAALRDAFTHHVDQTRVHRERLDLIFKQLNESTGTERCEAIAGLLEEGAGRLALPGPSDVRDAALIAAAQRVEHYEIAAYGTARTFARQLGDWEAERLLQQTLDEEGAADHRLTALAESGINQGATDRSDTLLNSRWSRLRFLDVDDLDRRALDYTGIRVRGTSADDLGTLDGFVVDGATGRPFYYVVDSGGWFLGRRYLVPVGLGRFDPSNRELSFGLSREEIARYPEFSTTAFMSMTEDETRRYERRVLQTVSPAVATTPQYWEAYERLPEYQEPDWLRSDAWSGFGYRPQRASGRTVGDIAAPETSWTSESRNRSARSVPSAAGHDVLPSVGGEATSRDPLQEEIVAQDEDARAVDPRDNTAPNSRAVDDKTR